MMTQVRKAIIPVAGFGTRLLPISKAIPKEMVPVVDRPLIQHVVEEALAAGINEIILVTRAGKSAIEDHFDAHFELEHSLASKGKNALLETLSAISPKKLKVTSVRQPNAKGLGHAIYCASHLLDKDEPFAVILPDVLVKPQVGSSACDLGSMVERWEASDASQIMVEAVPDHLVDQYGIVDVAVTPNEGESITMQGIVEKPAVGTAPSNLSVVGRYILPAQIMGLLADTPRGAGNEIQLTDAIATLQQSETVEAYRMKGQTFDCGSKLGYLKAVLHYGIEHPKLGVEFKGLIQELAL